MEPDELTQERIARNDHTFRQANEGIHAAAEAYEIEEDMRIPFICECADPACREIIRLSQDDYEAVRAESRHFLNVPGHHVAAKGLASVVSEHEGYVVVRKEAHAGEVVERLDERRDADISEAASE